jgi:hypothetical protein
MNRLLEIDSQCPKYSDDVHLNHNMILGVFGPEPGDR